MNSQAIREKFVRRFGEINDTYGFYGLTSYIDGIGFSVKKDLPDDRANTSLISFYIPEDSGTDNKKPIIIDATYGPRRGDSVALRSIEEVKVSSPVDLSSRDDYYYDAVNDKLFERDRETSPQEIIDDIYRKHTKSTRPITGLWLRAKIVFWRFFLGGLLARLSKFFQYVLRITTGDRYFYEPIMEKEVLNGKILRHRLKELIGKDDPGAGLPEVKDVVEKDEESAKFDFFGMGYMVSHWVIVFYCILHLLLYFIFCLFRWKPAVIVTIFKNPFLTVVYVVVSLWVLESRVPGWLKILIKRSAMGSFKVTYKRIRI